MVFLALLMKKLRKRKRKGKEIEENERINPYLL